jgi:hypothetical protein
MGVPGAEKLIVGIFYNFFLLLKCGLKSRDKIIFIPAIINNLAILAGLLLWHAVTRWKM